MSYRYFFYNEFVHVLHPATHRLFKRVDAGWVELCHPNEFQCFRLQAVELAASEVSRYDNNHRPAGDIPLPQV